MNRADYTQFYNAFFDNQSISDGFDRLRAFGHGLDRHYIRVNAAKCDGDVVYTYELPGVKRESITVEIDAGKITVTAKREEENIRYDRMEISHGEMSRTLPVPDRVDLENIDAKYSGGMLTLTFKKLENARSEPIRVQVVHS